MKKALLFAALTVFAAAPAAATHEVCLKAGVVLNAGTGPFYSWILIQESNYYVQDFISFGYETQFSFYKASLNGTVAGDGQISIYPLNVFLNSKIKILRKGALRPYVGAGFGFFSAVKSYPDHYAWDKALATQVLAGLSIGMGSRASIQVEFRMLNADAPDFKTKFMFVGGISY